MDAVKTITFIIFSHHPRSGLSLVELLVAMALLSLVMGMGFVATSAMQRGYLVEANLASHQLETARSAPEYATKTFTFTLGFPVRDRFALTIHAPRYLAYCQQAVSLPPNFQ